MTGDFMKTIAYILYIIIIVCCKQKSNKTVNNNIILNYGTAFKKIKYKTICEKLFVKKKKKSKKSPPITNEYRYSKYLEICNNVIPLSVVLVQTRF